MAELEHQARTLSFAEGLKMANSVLQKGQLGLVEQMKDHPGENLFFHWPPALNKLLRLSESVFVIADPKDVKPVLIDQQENIEKSTRDFRIIRSFLGNALVPVAGGDSWYARRKLLMPTFSHAKVVEFGQTINLEADRVITGLVDRGESFGLHPEMTNLTLKVINQFLFNEEIGERTQQEIGWHITTLAKYTSSRIAHLGFPPPGFPGKTNKEFSIAIEGMMRILGGFYDRHLELSEKAPDDMLNVLMSAKNAETGAPLTRKEVLEECLSMLIAGHETTANSLTWSMYLLAKHPEIQSDVRREIQEKVGSGTVSVEKLKEIPQVGWVLKEAMRLYPPVWVFSRKNNEGFSLPNGQNIPPKTFIAIVPWLMHRNPEYWQNPDQFKPQRFNPKNPDAGVKEAFMPFGMGQRRCIGADLAFTEASIILAKTLQKAEIQIEEEVNPALLITTRPDSAVTTRFCPII